MNFKGKVWVPQNGGNDSPDLFTLHLVNETSNSELKQHSGPLVRLTTTVVLAAL